MSKTLIFLLVFCALLSSCKPRNSPNSISESKVSSQMGSELSSHFSGVEALSSEAVEPSFHESSDSVSNTPKIDESSKEALSKSAVLLTQQLALCFSVADLERYTVPFPDKEHISTFIVALLTCSNSDYHPYHGYVTVDSEGYAHFPFNKCQAVVSELFGCAWAPAGDYNWEYDEKNQEHVFETGFGFGSGFECKNTEIVIDDRSIAVVYDIMTSSAFPEAELLGRFETRYTINSDENDRFYLTYIQTNRI